MHGNDDIEIDGTGDVVDDRLIEAIKALNEGKLPSSLEPPASTPETSGAAFLGIREACSDDFEFVSNQEEEVVQRLLASVDSPDMSELSKREDKPTVHLGKLKQWSTSGQFYQKFPQLRLLEKMRDVLNIKETDLPKQNDLKPLFAPRQDLNDKLYLWAGDITTLQIDAVVNSAHCGLTGGGGVDGYIHSQAGDGLLSECQTLGGCNPGESKITKGYDLPARFVIHTVGPTNQDAAVLASCYQRSLNLLVENNLRSIAFPCIATGHFGFSIIPATKIALATVRQWLEEHGDRKSQVDSIVFCTFTVRDEAVYETLLPVYFPV